MIGKIALTLPVRASSMEMQNGKLGGRATPVAGVRWINRLEDIDDGGNNRAPVGFGHTVIDFAPPVKRLGFQAQARCL